MYSVALENIYSTCRGNVWVKLTPWTNSTLLSWQKHDGVSMLAKVSCRLLANILRTKVWYGLLRGNKCSRFLHLIKPPVYCSTVQHSLTPKKAAHIDVLAEPHDGT